MSAEPIITFRSIPSVITTCSTLELMWNTEGDGDTNLTFVAFAVNEDTGGSTATSTLIESVSASDEEFSWHVQLGAGQYFIEAQDIPSDDILGTSPTFTIQGAVDLCLPSSTTQSQVSTSSKSSSSTLTFPTQDQTTGTSSSHSSSKSSTQNNATSSLSASHATTSSNSISALFTASSSSQSTSNHSSDTLSASSSSHNGPLIGGVGGTIGGGLLIALFLFAYLIHKRRRERKMRPLLQLERASRIDPLHLFTPAPGTEDAKEDSNTGMVQYVPRHRNTLARLMPTIKGRLSNRNKRGKNTGFTSDGGPGIADRNEMAQHIVEQQSQPLLPNTPQVNNLASKVAPQHDHDLRREIWDLRAEVEQLQASHEELIRTQGNLDRLPEYSEASQSQSS